MTAIKIFLDSSAISTKPSKKLLTLSLSEQKVKACFAATGKTDLSKVYAGKDSLISFYKKLA